MYTLEIINRNAEQSTDERPWDGAFTHQTRTHFPCARKPLIPFVVCVDMCIF